MTADNVKADNVSGLQPDKPHARVYKLLRLGRGLRTAAQLERDRDEADRLAATAATTAAATVPSATETR